MDETVDSSAEIRSRKRKRGQRVDIAGASEKFTSSFKRLMDANLQASDSFKDIGDQFKEDDLNNNNIEGSGETDTISIEHGKLLAKLPNQRTVSSSSLQSQQVSNHGKESEAPFAASIPLQTTKTERTSAARSNDSDISIDLSDKESADYTSDYHDRDDYNEDSTINSLDNFNRQRQDKLAAHPRLKVRKRQTRQQAMIDGQLRRNHEKNGDRFEFPDRIFKFDTSLNMPPGMPTNRYQTFDSENETFQIASARRYSTRSKSRNSQRLASTNRYSKLSHHYNRPSSSNLKQSFFQE